MSATHPLLKFPAVGSIGEAVMRRGITGVALLVALLLSPTATRADTPGGQVGTRLEVTFTKLRSDTGMVLAEIFNRADGFPTKSEQAYQRKGVPIHEGTARVVFENLPPGSYAVIAFHDENGNDRLDKNWMGIPTEGIAISNNAPHAMGPPKFKDARFDLSAIGGRTLVLPMQYH